MTAAALKALRNRLGWTQQKLADHLYTTQQAVSMWERGHRAVPGPVAELARRVEAEQAQDVQ